MVDAADGLNSLREAIDIANNLPGADEITFDFDHDGPATILLERGELRLTEAVTITGAGPELLTIDAQQNSRIFNITSEDGDFVVEGLTLTNGKTTERNENGGAIRSLTHGDVDDSQQCSDKQFHGGLRGWRVRVGRRDRQFQHDLGELGRLRRRWPLCLRGRDGPREHD